MINGHVVWYNQRDGFGIAKDEYGNEFYIDDSVLKCDKDSLKFNTLISFIHNPKIKDCICGMDVSLR